MELYAAFNISSVISRLQLTLFMSILESLVLSWGYEVSCLKTQPRKPQRIQCGSNQESLDYESKTLTPSHAGTPSPPPPGHKKEKKNLDSVNGTKYTVNVDLL